MREVSAKIQGKILKRWREKMLQYTNTGTKSKMLVSETLESTSANCCSSWTLALGSSKLELAIVHEISANSGSLVTTEGSCTKAVVDLNLMF
ncbi:hypothetical protein R3W88_031966 [Solanum pinnatisectum]|uniref:Uncharacterized protein n=1 Tax=Solanum pinnatisectum TaxID=50273 RepID=A0AAV9LPS8_9SOLN|nr:hypothetical protein R3W88_031966 [Solanum pinnatisectum]